MLKNTILYHKQTFIKSWCPI